MNAAAIIPALALLLIGALAKKPTQPTAAARGSTPRQPPKPGGGPVAPPFPSASSPQAHERQAAVNAAVANAIKHGGATSHAPASARNAMPQSGPRPTPPPAAAAASKPSPAADVEVTDANAPHVVAALALAEYLKKNPTNFGTKAKPDAMVKKLQTAMGNITADGIVGPMTTARAQALGVTLPTKPKKKK